MKLRFDRKSVNATIKLPASKSISNRLLILNELFQADIIIKNLSDSEDTLLLSKALEQIRNGENKVIDVHHAGTDMRFLTALLSIRNGEWIITGSERMKQRPIGILVDSLRSLGAEITYIENEGFPPLKINGKSLRGGHLEIDVSVSSQYVSAILMIAPLLDTGLRIRLKNKIVSAPYIQMTIELMKKFGIQIIQTENEISVAHSDRLNPGMQVSVEADWSAASYWYSICALIKNSEVRLEGLNRESLQGDSVLPELFNSLGVKTIFEIDRVILTNTNTVTKHFNFDFTECPDIAQTIAVTCFALNIPARLTGLSTLKNKETDRISALQTELKKCGADVLADNNSVTIRTQPESKHGQLNTKQIELKTYNDHRMAMAFAPLAVFGEVEVDDAGVVIKSYPDFWKDLKSAGFSCL